MKKISICKTKFLPFDWTLVDDEDYKWLREWRWHTDNKGYVVRRVRRDGKKYVVYMHREIMKTPEGMVTDHVNGNKVDNRRSNLRVCSDGQNKRNRDKSLGFDAPYKGAYWQKQIKRWYSRIQVNGRSIYLGTFSTPEEASTAYNVAAKKYHGKYMRASI